MDPTWIGTLRALYASNMMKIMIDDRESNWLTTSRALKQGCPLSSILFMLHIADSENNLQRTKAGFLVRTDKWQWDLRESTSFKIPGLFFADDIVLMAINRKEMRKLLKTASDFGDERDITFKSKKSAVLVFYLTNSTDCSGLEIQGNLIPLGNEYKYLGILLSDS